MGVTGDFAKLEQLRASLRRAASGGLTAELGQVLGAASIKLVADGFRAERDPYGRPWAPLSAATLKRRGESAKILRDTGRMVASVNFAAEARGFRLMIPTAYAPVHQYGATINARSNVRGGIIHGRNTKRGFRFSTPGKATTARRAKRATFGQITIPQRQMLPMSTTGGLGPIWLETYNRDTVSLLRRRLQVAA